MSLKWKLLIAIVILWILGAIGLSIHVIHCPPPSGSSQLIETIKIVLMLLGGLGVVLPTYLNVWQSIESNEVIQQRIDFDKINNSFDLLQKWDDPSLLTARRFSREIRDQRSKISDEELIKKIDTDDELKQSLILILDYFELIRISIINNRINEKTIKDSLGEVYIEIFKRFEAWISTTPKENYDDLKFLYTKWQ
jgi:hypothetical protein